LSYGLGGRGVAEGEPAHRAADSVRADHEVVLARTSVAELDRESPVPLAEAADASSHPEWDFASPVEQDRMEVCALEREAGPDAAPQLRDVHLDEQPAAVVADALPGNHDSSLRDGLLEPQHPERAGGVPGR
jgi:hypothetical protein